MSDDSEELGREVENEEVDSVESTEEEDDSEFDDPEGYVDNISDEGTVNEIMEFISVLVRVFSL